jgi:iron uptake system component EfeO
MPFLTPSRTLRTAAGGLVAGLALAGCGSSGDKAGTQSVTVTLTDAGCSPAKLAAKTGPLTIRVVNGGSSKVSELELKTANGIILGERENVVGGITGSFTLNLQPGRYVLFCPNGDTAEHGSLVVTGKPTDVPARADAAALAKATAAYRAYVAVQSAKLQKSTRAFVAALHAGDLERAKALFGPTRFHYEAIEPVAESFGDLDPEIDARAGDVPRATWTGFHRIEKILWDGNTTAGTAGYATKLLADVTTLNRKVRTLEFQAPQLANGAVELLNEVASSKITGEEDRYSHTDLSDFAGNVEGARQAFVLLRSALLDLGEDDLVKTIDARFTALGRGLDRYRRPTSLGYATYSALTPADRRTLARAVDALAEPLSTVAPKVS